MFDDNLRIQYKSETGTEPYMELSYDKSLEEILIIAGHSLPDFPLDEENNLTIPTMDYIEWLEQRALKTLEQ